MSKYFYKLIINNEVKKGKSFKYDYKRTKDITIRIKKDSFEIKSENELFLMLFFFLIMFVHMKGVTQYMIISIRIIVHDSCILHITDKIKQIKNIILNLLLYFVLFI